MNIDRTQASGAHILIVDDTPDNLDLLSSILSKRGYETRRAISGSIALQIAQSGWAELILLDIQMPEMDGYETCEKLKNNPQTKEIPVIFISALDNILDKKKAFKYGGVDYITKPFQIQEVVVRIANQIAIHAAQKKVIELNDQLEKKVRERTIALENANQKLQGEINRRQEAQDRLLKMALKDPTTGLGNRNSMISRLKKAIRFSQANSNYYFGLIVLECDRLKTIKRSLSHIDGNQLLMNIGNAIASCLSGKSLLCRLEGEEFAIYLDQIKDESEIIKVVKKIEEKFTIPFNQNRRKFLIKINFGIAIGNKDYQDTDRLLNDADIALQKAKEEENTSYKVFQPEMYLQLQVDTNFSKKEIELKQAIKRQEFINHYLPIAALSTGNIVELESLVRWQHPSEGIIFPQDFITIAEEIGLTIAIGDLALKHGCNQLKFWQQSNELQKDLGICFNLSAKQLFHTNLLPKIDIVLRKTRLNPNSLQIEISEKTLIENSDLTLEVLQKIKERGIKIGLDNFGVGYSSLTHIHDYPFDSLKIDRSLITKINTDINTSAMMLVEQIITIAHQMKMIVTATGIETQKQLDKLKKINCDRGQGYFISKVLEPKSVEHFLILSITQSQQSFVVS